MSLSTEVVDKKLIIHADGDFLETSGVSLSITLPKLSQDFP